MFFQKNYIFLTPKNIIEVFFIYIQILCNEIISNRNDVNKIITRITLKLAPNDLLG